MDGGTCSPDWVSINLFIFSQQSTDAFQGAYYFIIWRVWLIRCLDAGEANFKLDFSSPFSIPQVVPRTAGDVYVYKDVKKRQ